jgi:hypothetical protein
LYQVDGGTAQEGDENAAKNLDALDDNQNPDGSDLTNNRRVLDGQLRRDLECAVDKLDNNLRTQDDKFL